MAKPPKLTREQKIARFSWATNIDPTRTKLHLSPEQERLTDRSVERASSLNFAQTQNGPGNYIDRKFREFVLEYNNRVFKTFGSKQPESFTVLRDFVEPDDEALVLKILPEVHFSIDVDYILDRLTEPTVDRSAHDLYALKEGVIYSVHLPGTHSELEIFGVDGLSLFGWSCVRHDDELSILALAARSGPTTGLEVVKPDDHVINPDKPFLKAISEVDMNHQPFFELSELYPVVLLSRLDLSRSTTMVRFLLTERKSSFDVVTDNRESFTYFANGPFRMGSEKTAGLFDRSFTVLSEHSAAFALLGELPQLLIDLESHDDLKIVRVPTELYLNASKSGVRKAKKILHRDEVPNYIDVRTLTWVSRAEQRNKIEVVDYRIEQKGYWRNLRMDQVGVGRNGDKVLGKTWVTVQESWFETFGFSPPENSSTVSFKVGGVDSSVGELYVMRSALHPPDVYKVGYTLRTSDIRASQLAATSGQPDQFNVVQIWSVKSPRKIESLVHARLSRYRINSQREFFKVKFRAIREAIERAIDELDGDAS